MITKIKEVLRSTFHYPEDDRRHYVDEEKFGSPALLADEVVLWEGESDRIEHLMYWLPRSAVPALVWILFSINGLKIQIERGANYFTLSLGIILLLVGIAWLTLWVVSAILVRRYRYFVTSHRIIRYNRRLGKSLYLNIKDIDEAKSIKGWRRGRGSLVVSGGWVRTPDGHIDASIKFIGVNSVDSAKSVINREIGNG